MILAGVVAPDGGRIAMDGAEVRFAGPKEAQAAGIGTVFQELSLVDGLTVAENVFANRAPVGPLTWLDRKRLFRETQSLLQPLASTLSPNRRVATLTTGGRQIVEIAKALSLKVPVLLPVDLSVHAGEVVGLAGLVGSGRSRLVRALFGVERIDAGMVLVEGRPVRLRSPWHAVRRGMGMVPSDRKGEGVFQRMSLERNLLAAALNRITRMGLVQPRAGRRLGQELVRALGIRARGLDQAMVRLSGGNQQKAVLARWIATRPRVLIVDEPTQGIDVGAKAEIHRLLRQLANDGLAVLMVSSDLAELLGMCDRIAVMAGGRVQAVFDGRSATEEGVMTLAAGGGAA